MTPTDDTRDIIDYLASIRKWLVALTVVVLTWSALVVIGFVLMSLPEPEPDPNDCIFTEVGGVYREVCE